MVVPITSYKFHPDCERWTLALHKVTGDARMIVGLEKAFTPAQIKALKAKGKKLSDTTGANDPVNGYYAFLIDAAIRKPVPAYTFWKAMNG